MATNNLLEAFRKTYHNLRLSPLLTPEDLAQFRVEYGTDTRKELEHLIEDCSPENNKVIFTGHLGCGKSTLLADFARRMRNRYFVVFFSITDMIEMSDIDDINILFVIGIKMMYEADKDYIKIKDSIRNNFYEWFATKTRTHIDEFKKEGNFGINLFESLKSTIKNHSIIRNELKEEFKPKTSDLIDRIDEIASVIKNATGRDILLIIDDLDKLQLDFVSDLYQNSINVLMQPSFRIIYTTPISVTRDIKLNRTLETATNNQFICMHVSKFFKQGENRNIDAVPDEENLKIFQELLRKRIAGDLIEPDILEKIILKSGGVLREAIRIMNKCCSKCLILIRQQSDSKKIKINQDILEEVLKDLRLDFTRYLSNLHYPILTTIYNNFNPDSKNDEERKKFLELLHELYILEYRNGELWYEVHPIIIDLLNFRGLL